MARSNLRHPALALGMLASFSLASCLLPELTKRAYSDGEGDGASGGSGSASGGKQSGAGKTSGGTDNEGATSSGGSNTTPQGGDGGDGATGGTGNTSGSSTGGLPPAGSSPGGSANAGTSNGQGGAGGDDGGDPPLDKFSFFVTSLKAMRELSGNQDGFGGDLRYGKASGLAGADAICTEIAEGSMAGSGVKGWRAFLSTSAVNAIDRIGNGPWYDRAGRLLASTRTDLLQTRPIGDLSIVSDLPNEEGVPNHDPDLTGAVDNQAVLTGSNSSGGLDSATATCADWTSNTTHDKPRVGAAWVTGQPSNWISHHLEGGCLPGGTLLSQGGPPAGDYRVGAGGGYGAIYCFALEP